MKLHIKASEIETLDPQVIVGVFRTAYAQADDADRPALLAALTELRDALHDAVATKLRESRRSK